MALSLRYRSEPDRSTWNFPYVVFAWSRVKTPFLDFANPVSTCSRGLRETWLLVSLFWRAFGFFVSCIVRREKRLFNTESERSFFHLQTFSPSKLHWNLTFVSLKISFHHCIYFDSDKSLRTVPKKSQKSLCLARTVRSEARRLSKNVQDKGYKTADKGKLMCFKLYLRLVFFLYRSCFMLNVRSP